jgi:hypothetical protein
MEMRQALKVELRITERGHCSDVVDHSLAVLPLAYVGPRASRPPRVPTARPGFGGIYLWRNGRIADAPAGGTPVVRQARPVIHSAVNVGDLYVPGITPVLR